MGSHCIVPAHVSLSHWPGYRSSCSPLQLPSPPTRRRRRDRQFLSPTRFIAASWQKELPLDLFLALIFKGAVATVGGLVDCKGSPVAASRDRPAGGTFLIRYG